MKAELTLPERPSVLYLIAVLDVLAVLLIFFTLIPVVAQQAGTLVERVETTSRLPPIENSITLSARPGPRPVIFLGMKTVSLEDLPEALQNLKQDSEVEWVMFIPDKKLAVGVAEEIEDAVLNADLQLARVGKFPVEESADSFPLP